MLAMLTIYKKTSEMATILEHIDVEGRNCFWYLNEYQMFKILETKIMNQYILEKWEGPVVKNSSVA